MRASFDSLLRAQHATPNRELSVRNERFSSARTPTSLLSQSFHRIDAGRLGLHITRAEAHHRKCDRSAHECDWILDSIPTASRREVWWRERKRGPSRSHRHELQAATSTAQAHVG